MVMSRELVRLSVNLNPESAEALKEMAKRRGISYTEAIRRCVGIYKYVLDEHNQDRKITTSKPNGKKVKELILL